MAIVKRVRDYKKNTKYCHKKPITNPFLFQTIVASHIYYGQKHYLERERERCFDLRLFKKGSYKLTIGDKEYQINSPCLIFFNHYTNIKLETIEAKEYEEVALYFVGPHLDEYRRAILNDTDTIFIEKYNISFIERTIDKIIDIIENKIDREEISLLIYQLLLNLISVNRKTIYSTPIEKAKSWIDNNYYKKINLNLLCQVVGYSNYYLGRLFKKEVGKSPMEYARNVRIEKGIVLLTTTNKSITAISQEVGFNDRRSFVSQFKKEMGVNPYNYRKEYRKYDEYS